MNFIERLLHTILGRLDFLIIVTVIAVLVFRGDPDIAEGLRHQYLQASGLIDTASQPQ